MTVLTEPPASVRGPERRGSAPQVPYLEALSLFLGIALVVLVGVLALLALAADPTAAPTGVAVSGPLTERVLPAARGLADLALCILVGQLLWAAWSLGEDRLAVTSRLLRAARWSAGCWAAATAVWGWATAADVLGVPLSRVSATELEVLWRLPQGRSLGVLGVTALAVVVLVGRVRSSASAYALVVLALAGTAPLLLTGHASATSSHYLAGQALVLHVLAVVLWAGGLLAAVAHLRRDRELLVALLPRYSAVALACFVVTAVSGLAGGWSRLGLDLDLWRSTYGALLLAKVACLVLLGVCGALHRSVTLRRLTAGRPHAFLRLATGEAVLMGTALALAVVLARTAPPAGALARAVPPHASAFPTVDRGITPAGLRGFLLESRPDVLVITAVLAVVAAYLVKAHTVRVSEGTQAWPGGRVAAFLAGAGVTLWALAGGLGAYSTALLSAQVGQLVALLLVAPPLLLAGLEPLRSTGAPGLRRLRELGVADGVLAALFALTAVYATPLLVLSLRTTAMHTLTALMVLGAGALLAGAAGRVWRERRPGDLLLVLGVPGLVLVVHAARLRPGRGLAAGGWFDRLDWWWADAVADQRLAAELLGAAGVLLLVVALVAPILPRRAES